MAACGASHRETVMAYQQIESGFRNEAIEEYSGHRIRVVSAYDGRADQWWVHVYIAKPGGAEIKIHSLDGDHANTAVAGLEGGFAQAKALIDQSA